MKRCRVCHKTKHCNADWICSDCYIPPITNKYFGQAFMKSEVVSIEMMLDDLRDVDIKSELKNLLTYDDFLVTLYWKIISTTVKRNAGNKCSKCGHRKKLQAHHTDYSILGEEWKHIGTKLICLCEKCHRTIHGT